MFFVVVVVVVLFRGGHTWQSAMPSHPFNNAEHRHKTTKLKETRLYVTS